MRIASIIAGTASIAEAAVAADESTYDCAPHLIGVHIAFRLLFDGSLEA